MLHFLLSVNIAFQKKSIMNDVFIITENNISLAYFLWLAKYNANEKKMTNRKKRQHQNRKKSSMIAL